MIREVEGSLLPPKGALRYVGAAVAYLAVYLALDAISTSFAVRTGVSVFYLPPGLSLVLLLIGGMRFFPVAVAAPLLVGGVTNPLPVDPPELLLVEFSLAASYGAGAFVLLRVARLDCSLSSLSSMTWFLGVAVIVPLATATVVVSEFVWQGSVPANERGDTIVRFWIGDAIGVLTVAPCALIAWSRVARWRAAIPGGIGREGRRKVGETILQSIVLAATVWLAITHDDDGGDLSLVYLTFIPLAWMAVRRGVAGAALGVALASVLTAAISADDSARGNPQLFLIALSATTLMLGAIITERRRAWDEAREQAALLSAVIRSTTDAVYLKGKEDFRYLLVNDRAAAAFGTTARAMIGKTDFDFQDDLTAQALRDDDQRVLATGEPSTTELVLPDGTGGELVMQSSKAICRTPTDEVIGLIGIARDVTDRKIVERQLAHRTLHDDLTGLPNRTLLRDRAAQALARARRSDGLVAVLFCDLDRFKVVNDSFGHAAGDEVLRHVGQRLCALTREEDTVARVGGDEFVIVCQDIASNEEAMSLTHRIRDALRVPVSLGSTSTAMTMSIGVVVSKRGSRETRTVDALLRDGDAAMYRAKAAGRNAAVLFDEGLGAAVSRRVAVEMELRKALPGNQLRVLYQPEVSLADRRVVGVEALVRWSHPERGLLAPGEFIDVAEETGLIIDVGAFVLNTVCEQAAHWRARRGDRSQIATWMNVSGRELVDPGFVARVCDALRRCDLPPGALGLELTESFLIGHEQSMIDKLYDLDQLGVRLALDDFGTGFSSLTYLRRFPVQVLKIDQAFVAGLTGDEADPNDAEITRAVIGMAANLGLTCIAEGVATQAQADWLGREGCPIAQGYLFGRPSDAAAIDSMATASGGFGAPDVMAREPTSG